MATHAATPAQRRKRRIWLACGITTLAALLGGACIYVSQRPAWQPARIKLPADGAAHDALHISLPRFLGFDSPLLASLSDEAPVRLLERDNSSTQTNLEAMVTSPVMPGRSVLRLRWRNRDLAIPVSFLLDLSDSYSDGTPDFLRLHTAEDRDAFRAWFTRIAEAQADLPPGQLPPEISDCAALLRFSYRETLHAHDAGWLASHPNLSPSPSIRQYSYPQTPLHAALFRVRPGTLQASDLSNGSFAQFADASTLFRDNSFLVSRDIHRARKGDLIFYRQLDENTPYDVPDAARAPSTQPGHSPYHSPFHSMIICGDKADWVVYHTGPIGQGKGEMRRLSMQDLVHHPDARWRPIASNANFLGVYRWNILREDR